MGEKGYKAFNSDFTCKGKQYEENTTYEESGDRICDKGVMHYCENPFDVLNYYPFVDNKGRISEFAEVEALGKVYHEGDKSATNKLYIGTKLGLKGFIKACIDFAIEKTKITDATKIGSSGYNAQIGSSGYNAKIGSSGDYAKIGSSGDCAQIGSSGYNAQIGSSGYNAQIGSSGYNAKIGSSGDYAKIGSSGYYAQIGSSGYCAKIGSSGNWAQINSTGENAVIAAIGSDSMAKAKKGSWITLAEYDDKFKPVCVKTEYVDGERIKEDMFYRLVNGNFKEVEK